jgi:hypothetical protein
MLWPGAGLGPHESVRCWPCESVECYGHEPVSGRAGASDGMAMSWPRAARERRMLWLDWLHGSVGWYGHESASGAVSIALTLWGCLKTSTEELCS